MTRIMEQYTGSANRKKDFLFRTGSLCLGEKIRTSGLLNPIQARYQTAPHPVNAVYTTTKAMIFQPMKKAWPRKFTVGFYGIEFPFEMRSRSDCSHTIP